MLEEHLRGGCDECAAELREFREIAASLVLGLDPVGSEEGIWTKLDAHLHSAKTNSRSISGGEKIENAGRPRRIPVGVWRTATGILAAAVAGLVIYAGLVTDRLHRVVVEHQHQLTSLNSQINSLQTALASAHSQVSALERVLADRLRLERVLMAPDLRLIRLQPLKPAPGAAAVVAVSDANHSAMIQAFGLPPMPPGKTYELWWITKQSGPIKAGLFQVASDRLVIAAASALPLARMCYSARLLSNPPVA